MGVKFNREYEDILNDLVRAIGSIPDCHTAFEMDGDDWRQLDDNSRAECIRALADDMFYGLGAEPEIQIGSGTIQYDRSNHIIKVTQEPHIVHVVYLI